MTKSEEVLEDSKTTSPNSLENKLLKTSLVEEQLPQVRKLELIIPQSCVQDLKKAFF